MREHFERLFPGLLGLHGPDLASWRDETGRLYDTRRKQYLYQSEGTTDHQHEATTVEQWLRQINCLQTLDGPTMKSSLKTLGKEFQESPFDSIMDLDLRNIHDSGIDYHGSWAAAELDRIINEHMDADLGPISDHSGGLLLIYGIATATSISKVIQASRPRIILIFEEDTELCTAMLDEKGCQALLEQINQLRASLFLITETDPDKAFINARGLVEATNLLSQEKIFSITFRDSDLRRSIKQRFENGDSMLRDLRLLGFFVDEIHMSMNAAISFCLEPPRVISHKLVDPHQLHAVVAASGPSLQQSIPWLLEHRNRFHLFSCYSTLGALLTEDIQPDYHCNQERHACHIPIISNSNYEDFALRSTLLCSANNDPRMNRFYKECVAFFRGASSASALFAGHIQNCIAGEGPEVANLALNYAVLLGYRTIHLVGVDLGSADPSLDRVQGAIHHSNRRFDIKTLGNKREEVWTSHALLEAADYMSWLISGAVLPGGERIKDLKVYNYSDGIAIPGTIAAEHEDLHVNLGHDQHKKACIDIILKQIPKPDVLWGRARFLCFDWEYKVKTYTTFLREATSDPFNRNRLEVYLQSSERQLQSLGEQVMPRLMAGSLTRAWYFILMVHDRLNPDQQLNPEWHAKATEILQTVIASMEKITLEMSDYIEKLNSIDDHKMKSTTFEC